MSSQGKYKDIILVDEKSNDSSGSENFEMPGKRKRSSEDATPEEKRRRFLERNRFERLLTFIRKRLTQVRKIKSTKNIGLRQFAKFNPRHNSVI